MHRSADTKYHEGGQKRTELSRKFLIPLEFFFWYKVHSSCNVESSSTTQIDFIIQLRF